MNMSKYILIEQTILWEAALLECVCDAQHWEGRLNSQHLQLCTAGQFPRLEKYSISKGCWMLKSRTLLNQCKVLPSCQWLPLWPWIYHKAQMCRREASERDLCSPHSRATASSTERQAGKRKTRPTSHETHEWKAHGCLSALTSAQCLQDCAVQSLRGVQGPQHQAMLSAPWAWVWRGSMAFCRSKSSGPISPGVIQLN